MKMTENNRMLKLIALAIAIVLWLYVGTQQDPLAQHTYEVQLEMENLPVDKTASLSEETVKVRVMGRQDRLNALSGSDFKASVDLSDVEEGEHAPGLPALEQVLPAGEHRVGIQGLAGDVLGVGGAAQPQPGDILLLPVLGEGHRPGGLSHKHRQDAGGHGIQGPGMAHLLGFQNAPQLRADIHRCPAGGLVDDDDSVCHGSLLV